MLRPHALLAATFGSLLAFGFSSAVQTRGAMASAEPSVAQALAAETHRRLAEEFSSQPVAFDLAGTQVWPQQAGVLRVRGEGTADFGVEGQATATIEGMYDPQQGRWLRLEYQLL